MDGIFKQDKADQIQDADHTEKSEGIKVVIISKIPD
jgi:hypothetical protein